MSLSRLLSHLDEAVSLLAGVPSHYYTKGCDEDYATPLRKAFEALFEATTTHAASRLGEKLARGGSRPRRIKTHRLTPDQIWKLFRLWDEKIVNVACGTANVVLAHEAGGKSSLRLLKGKRGGETDGEESGVKGNSNNNSNNNADKEEKDSLLDEEEFAVHDMEKFAGVLERRFMREWDEEEKAKNDKNAKSKKKEEEDEEDDDDSYDEPDDEEDEEVEENDELGFMNSLVGLDDDKMMKMGLYVPSTSNNDASGGDGDDEEEEEEDDDGANAMYDDFFGSGKKKNNNKTQQKKATTTKIKGNNIGLNEDEEDDDDDEERPPHETKHERRRRELMEKIRQLEEEALGEKSWELRGEITRRARPVDSLLERDDVDVTFLKRHVPVMTPEVVATIEEVIKRRIFEGTYDDVRPKEPIDVSGSLSGLPSLSSGGELSAEKSKLGLAEEYAKEFEEKVMRNASAQEMTNTKEREEITMMMEVLFAKLDALTNFHFTPKPIAVPSSSSFSAGSSGAKANVAAINIEDVIPGTEVGGSESRNAPEEVLEKQKGLGKARGEMTQEERRAHRRGKKEKGKKTEGDGEKKVRKERTTAKRKREVSDATDGERVKWSSSNQVFSQMMKSKDNDEEERGKKKRR